MFNNPHVDPDQKLCILSDEQIQKVEGGNTPITAMQTGLFIATFSVSPWNTARKIVNTILSW